MNPGQRAASTWGSPPGPLLACTRGAVSCLSKHRCTDKPPADHGGGGRAEGGHRLRRLPAGTRPRRGHGRATASPLDSPGEQSELPPWFWCRFLGFLPAGTELVSPDPPGRLHRSGTAPVSVACQHASGTRLSVCQHASVPLSCKLGPVPAPPAAHRLPRLLISQHQAGWDRLGLGAGSRAPRAELAPAHIRSEGQ